MPFEMQVRVDDQWKSLSPKGGAPYQFPTEAEARVLLKMCFGSTPTVRVLEVPTKKTFIVTLKAQAEVTGTIRVEAQNDLEAYAVATEKARQDYVTWGHAEVREGTVRRERVFLVDLENTKAVDP